MKYETEEDLKNEADVIEFLNEHSDWVIRDYNKLPAFKYCLDYAVCEQGTDEISFFCEIKCYKKPYKTYRNVMLSMYKVSQGLAMKELSKVPFVWIVRFSDGIHAWRRIESSDLGTVKWGGRKNPRPNSSDREPLYYFPIEEFKIIKKTR